MADDFEPGADSAFALRVLWFYNRLIPAERSAEPDLGGRLLYARELDEDGCGLIAAANIAGAASLCVTADPQQQKQAIRDGIVDFLVRSLSEALRILKNEIRKRAPVAVCVAAPSADVETEMAERGVVPDFLRPDDSEADRPLPADIALVSWSVSAAPARWMPKLDAFALECAGSLSHGAQRWLRFSPRYLGRRAQSFHIVLADRTFAKRFMEGGVSLEGGAIPAKLQVSYRGGAEEFNLPNWKKDESGARSGA